MVLNIHNFAKKITNSNRYILEKKLIVLGVFVVLVCGAVFLIQSSAQTQETIFDVMKEQGTNNVYMTMALPDDRKYKRLLPNTQILELYNTLNLPTQTTPKSTLDQYTTTTLIAISRGRYAPPSGIQEPVISVSDYFNITPNGEIQYLLMSAPYALDSGYNPLFYVDRKEVEGNYYTRGDSIYYTGQADYSTNTYTYTSTLRSQENNSRIFHAVIPEGQNECSIEQNYIAIIRSASDFKTILPERLKQGGYENILQGGGNAIIHIQPVLDSQTTDSSDLTFTLRCRRTGPAQRSINTVDISDPEQSERKEGTGEEIVTLTLEAGYHACTFPGTEYDVYSNSDSLNFAADGDPVAGGTTYTVLVDRIDNNQDTDSDQEWEIRCTKIQVIPLQQGVVNHISNTGAGVFQLGTPSNAESLQCLNKSQKIILLQQILPNKERTADVLEMDIALSKRIDGSAFFLNTRHLENLWSVECSVSGTDTTNELPSIQGDIPGDSESVTPLTGTPVTASTTNNNPNLLRNVVARADEIGREKNLKCANHLLDLDKSTDENGVGLADILLVPEDLCIQYKLIFNAGGWYYPGQHNIEVNYTEAGYRSLTPQNGHSDRLYIQGVLIHELCHAQQDYYAPIGTWEYANPQFTANISEAYKRRILYGRTKRWWYPDNGEYNGMYGTQDYHIVKDLSPPYLDRWNVRPVQELGAEFCMIFIAGNNGRRDIADRKYGPNSKQPTLRNGKPVVNTVLKDQDAQEWFNKYMITADLKSITTPILNSFKTIKIKDLRRRGNKLLFEVEWDEPSSEELQAIEDKGLSLQYDFQLLYQPYRQSRTRQDYNYKVNESPQTIEMNIEQGQNLENYHYLIFYTFPPRVISPIETLRKTGSKYETYSNTSWMDFQYLAETTYIDLKAIIQQNSP